MQTKSGDYTKIEEEKGDLPNNCTIIWNMKMEIEALQIVSNMKEKPIW